MFSIVFEVDDRLGRKIRLTKRQWSHIIRRHGYMNDYLERIKATIMVPDKLIEISKNKGYYYRHYKDLKHPNRYILVVVKYLNGDGFLITSYLVGRII